MGEVIQMFGRKKTTKQEVDVEVAAKAAADFEAVHAKNHEVKTRMEKERLQANKNVLKSYRIK